MATFDPYKAPQASLDVPPPLDPASTVPPALIQLMAQTRPWVRLISVLFFVGLGLGALAVVALGTVSSALVPRGMNVAMFIPMLLMMVLYIPPAFFLWQYASGIRRLQDGGGMTAFEDALTRQKSFWKYLGILATVLMGLYGLFFLMGILGVALKR